MTDSIVPYQDLERMADTVVKAGLFPGIKTQQQALTLFLVAQAEGLHPMTAALRYNVIQGRPAMKAEAMLASFMERGGTVAWTEYTDAAVTGVFTSKGVPSGVTVRWTMEDARRAGVTMNQTWTKYPRQMLKARVASDGVRMADPSVNSGRYTPEEVREFDEPQTVRADAEIVGDTSGTRTIETGQSLGSGGSVPSAPAEATDAPDLTPILQASLDHISEIKRPVKCPHCASDCAIYPSTQTGKNAGRKYRQCKVAHERVEELIALEGFTAQNANAAVRAHYREWVEPPRKTATTQGEAPEAEEMEPPTPKEPSPSIFDPEQIRRDVEAKLAAEK